MLGARVEQAVDGSDLAGVEQDLPAVSVYGSPAVFSMRRERWRFYWHSGIDPFTKERIEPESAVEAIEIAPPDRRTRKQADEVRKAELAAGCLTRFRACVK
jgi:hypothetical protein